MLKKPSVWQTTNDDSELHHTSKAVEVGTWVNYNFDSVQLVRGSSQIAYCKLLSATKCTELIQLKL